MIKGENFGPYCKCVLNQIDYTEYDIDLNIIFHDSNFIECKTQDISQTFDSV